MNSEQFERLLAQDHFSPAVLMEREVGYSLGAHEHPFDACALITAGDITLVVGGVTTTYREGDVFRLPAGTVHEESAGPQGVRYLSGRRNRAQEDKANSP